MSHACLWLCVVLPAAVAVRTATAGLLALCGLAAYMLWKHRHWLKEGNGAGGSGKHVGCDKEGRARDEEAGFEQ